ncbi:MAG: hypothetical protein L3J69_18465, partial [Desulfobacula sp.]|nr:hypothetical protein [Desulfobacula sp.]
MYEQRKKGRQVKGTDLVTISVMLFLLLIFMTNGAWASTYTHSLNPDVTYWTWDMTSVGFDPVTEIITEASFTVKVKGTSYRDRDASYWRSVYLEEDTSWSARVYADSWYYYTASGVVDDLAYL